MPCLLCGGSSGICDTCWRIGFEKSLAWHVKDCSAGCFVNEGNILVNCEAGEKIAHAWFDSFHEENAL